MAYSDFTLAELKSNFQLTVDEDTNLFVHTPEADLPICVAQRIHSLATSPWR